MQMHAAMLAAHTMGHSHPADLGDCDEFQSQLCSSSVSRPAMPVFGVRSRRNCYEGRRVISARQNCVIRDLGPDVSRRRVNEDRQT